MSRCRVTGKTDCHCPPKTKLSPMGSALMVDMKAALRFVFTDHANYTSWLIVETLPKQTAAAESVGTRLMKNPRDINMGLRDIIGHENGDMLENLFREHLTLAANLLGLLLADQDVTATAHKFFENGNVIGEILNHLNPQKISLEHAQMMMKEHNTYVIKLAKLRKAEEYVKYVLTYDEYFAHMMKFSDAVYELLTM